ncbi:DUF4352 domain-containing protein [Streptomyces sp. LUP47B]|uniref:DUF4352 domain-containing protein n=1 Tax=Streptomyces sp. LUP47B TaxID=1890286 RepID=UPI00114C9FA0|nr:DUF4352 domain-containing protein [Streptomyces sp. LUP47B]
MPSATTTTTITSAQTVITTPGADETPVSSPSSSKPFTFGNTWKLNNIDPAEHFEGTLTVLSYKQGFTSVGKASEEAGEPGYVWAYADLKLCGTKGSYTDNTTSWTLYYSDGSRINPSGTTYGDFPKPEVPTEVTVTAGKSARGKLVFTVPSAKRPGVRAVPARRLGRTEGVDGPEGVTETEKLSQSTTCGSRK